jgi:hypothetical protein
MNENKHSMESSSSGQNGSDRCSLEVSPAFSKLESHFDALRRYVPLLVWSLAILTILCIALKIIGYGYLPMDDALRHAGKAVSGKPWNEILVMRERFSMDHNPGWHTILGGLHQTMGWNTDGLVAFAVTSLLVLFCLVPLPWLRRPEAWIATILIFAIASPGNFGRLSLGRPYILTMAVLVTLMLWWTHRERHTAPMLIASTLLIALSTWAHGSWYLMSLPVAAFFLALEWRKGLALLGCWLVGSFMGACLTGHPFKFLFQAIDIMLSCFGNHVLQRTLVTEFRPSDGSFSVLVIVGLLLLWRHSRGEWSNKVVFNPVFILAGVGWFLGLKVVRFWDDWGWPAIALWVALELQQWFVARIPADSLKRLVLTLFVVSAAYVAATSDRAGRWTWNLTTEYLTPENADVEGWLPEPGGIIYSTDMGVFYRTFFKNPHAPWRYILGFESTFMPEEDLAIHRNVQWNFGAAKAYEPWVAKMRPEDRLVITASSGSRPSIPGLEWHYAATDTWIGRTPRLEPEDPPDSAAFEN